MFSYLGLSGEVSEEQHGTLRKSFAYDAMGRRTGMSTSDGGATSTYTFVATSTATSVLPVPRLSAYG